MNEKDWKQIGRRSQALGESFEEIILYLAGMSSRCLLFRQYPEVKFFSGGAGKVVGHGGPDFIGVFDGQAIIFDAKATNNKKSLGFPKKRRHQFDDLVRANAFGFVSGYLVHWVRWHEVEWFPVWDDDVWPFRVVRGDGLAKIAGLPVQHEMRWLDVLFEAIVMFDESVYLEE